MSFLCPGRDGNGVDTLHEAVSRRAKRPDTISGPQDRFSDQGALRSTPSVWAEKRRDRETILRLFYP